MSRSQTRVFAQAVLTALGLLLLSASAFGQYSQPMRDVDNPARQPFRYYGSFDAQPGLPGSDLLTVVPAGKRLVIEGLYVKCSSNKVKTIQFFLFTPLGPAFNIPMIEFSLDSQGAAAQNVRLYINPGEQPSWQGYNVDNLNVTSCRLLVSGYYVNLP